ncbi:MAG: CtrA inhibitor SciP [Paracoccaceae bacterium]
MYHKRIEGPTSVRLPDGRILSLSDLPPADTVRWVASRKAVVLRAVAYGLVTRDWAMTTYGLSREEFEGWLAAMATHGERALRTTKLHDYRQPEGDHTN